MLVERDRAQPIGVIFVHGIGEPSADDLRRKFVKGLASALPEATFSQAGDVTTLGYREHDVRLYDFSWTGSCAGDPDPDRWSLNWPVIAALPWLPSFNLQQGLYRLYKAGDYSKVYVTAWTVVLMPITLAFFSIYLALKALDKLPGRMMRNRHRAYAEELAGAVRPDGTLERRRWPEVMHRVWARYPLPSQRLVNDYVHVVLNYVYSALGEMPEGDRLHCAAERVVDSFRTMLKRASDDGCCELQVVAHSLGSLVAYQGLMGEWRQDLAVLDRVTTLHTIGSPLEKIRFFWPEVIAATERCQQQPASARSGRRLVWHNFYDPLDVIAGKLKRFDAKASLQNHRVRGAAGLISSHTVYERSSRFVSVVTNGLFGCSTAPKRRVVRRLVDATRATLESIAALAAFVVVVFLGAVELMIGALGLPVAVGISVDALGGSNTGAKAGSIIAFALFLVVCVWAANFGRTMARLLAFASSQRSGGEG